MKDKILLTKDNVHKISNSVLRLLRTYGDVYASPHTYNWSNYVVFITNKSTILIKSNSSVSVHQALVNMRKTLYEKIEQEVVKLDFVAWLKSTR